MSMHSSVILWGILSIQIVVAFEDKAINEDTLFYKRKKKEKKQNNSPNLLTIL
jgi:hypothetical protein